MQLTKLNSEVAEIKRSGANEYNASIINNKQSKNTASSKADAGTAAATSTVTLTHSTDHKKMVADEGELWKGANEVAVRAYNEVKSMIMLYKQPNS